MSRQTVVRFAPSPTGHLHVGGARTAIFNWLFARHEGGTFHLRIEDTDRARSSDEMTRAIFEGLTWLGIDWDGEPWIQSEHIEHHREECLRLEREGRAYWCWCTPDELAARRAEATDEGTEYRYDRQCLRLSEAERSRRLATDAPRVLRFRVPEGVTTFYDIVHESTEFQNAEIDDFIILRSDGTPVYQVAVVVDDHDMGVTHVIRGDDHLSNTPKQILLYQAFGYDVPMFGHVPLILGADKKRLSKRHGATSVVEYQSQGFLPEAMFNFLVLLGWSPGNDLEIMTRDEMVEQFDATRLLKKSSVFDEEKLRWMNGMHIRLLPEDELLRRVHRHQPEWIGEVDDAWLVHVVRLMQERMVFLADVFEKGWYFFRDPDAYDEQVVAKQWKPGTAEHVRVLREAFAVCEFTEAELERVVREHAEREGVGAGKVIHPLRLALTGAGASPGLFEMMVVLGRETCLRRLDAALLALG